jgi:hypothetical protein
MVAAFKTIEAFGRPPAAGARHRLVAMAGGQESGVTRQL